MPPIPADDRRQDRLTSSGRPRRCQIVSCRPVAAQTAVTSRRMGWGSFGNCRDRRTDSLPPAEVVSAKMFTRLSRPRCWRQRRREPAPGWATRTTSTLPDQRSSDCLRNGCSSGVDPVAERARGFAGRTAEIPALAGIHDRSGRGAEQSSSGGGLTSTDRCLKIPSLSADPGEKDQLARAPLANLSQLPGVRRADHKPNRCRVRGIPPVAAIRD